MRIRSRRFLALAIVLAVGCKGAECKVETTQYTKSLDAIGFAGATQGVKVARFDLVQDFVSHTPYEACAQGPLQDVGVVNLKITSLVPTPVLLKYDLQGLDKDGLPIWSHQDTIGVTIAPNKTLDVGQVFTSPHILNDGGARILLQAAEYVP